LKASAVSAVRHHTPNCNAPGRRRFALNGAIISADHDWRAACVGISFDVISDYKE
jgi:hypothetical protein